MSKSLTQIQDDTFKIYTFKVNLLTFSVSIYLVLVVQWPSVSWVIKCCLEMGKSKLAGNKLSWVLCGLFEWVYGGKKNGPVESAQVVTLGKLAVETVIDETQPTAYNF